MRLLITTIISTLILSCSNPYKDKVNTSDDYQVIPQPKSLKIANGRFLVDDKTTISYVGDLQKEASYLAELLSTISGEKASLISDKKKTKGNVLLELNDSIDAPEEYRLTITYDKIHLAGKSAKGVFYGIQTLSQLLSNDSPANKPDSTLTIPAVNITDEPRFEYRGMMLDVCRHFFPVDFVKKYIDILALHKMNTFHWHLTDDQGWRIEIKQYPRLTEIGAYRNGTITGHYPGDGNDQERYGGFYTQDDIKDIVAYAADRHITVIPEIELPGHSSAAIAAYPYLSCFPEEPTKIPNDMMSIKGRKIQKSGTPKIVQETWGVMDDVYCAGKETTFEFLENVLTEVIALFPSEYIHIGGDECPKGNWERCPSCQKRIKELGLEDEHELQSYFVHRIEKFLNSKGKNIIGWDEITEGGLSPTATVMYWRGWLKDEPKKVAKQGNDIIMTPTGYSYFDAYQVDKEDQDKEPLAIGGFISVPKVYSFEPISENITAPRQKQFLGAQANLWTEYIATEDHAEYMVLPRMAALSEVIWSPKESKDWTDFQKRLPRLTRIYADKGWNFAKHSLE